MRYLDRAGDISARFVAGRNERDGPGRDVLPVTAPACWRGGRVRHRASGAGRIVFGRFAHPALEAGGLSGLARFVRMRCSLCRRR
jgi:hypothetical protein